MFVVWCYSYLIFIYFYFSSIKFVILKCVHLLISTVNVDTKASMALFVD